MLDKAFRSFDETVSRAEISMTPLIDMVFLLLIFFVVTTTFTKETGIRVDKARAATSQIIERQLFLVSIDREGSFWYDKSRRSLEEIVEIAVGERRGQPNLNIVIIPDRKAATEPLITVMDRLRQRGITRFSIGTQPVSAQ